MQHLRRTELLEQSGVVGNLELTLAQLLAQFPPHLGSDVGKSLGLESLAAEDEGGGLTLLKNRVSSAFVLHFLEPVGHATADSGVINPDRARSMLLDQFHGSAHRRHQVGLGGPSRCRVLVDL